MSGDCYVILTYTRVNQHPESVHGIVRFVDVTLFTIHLDEHKVPVLSPMNMFSYAGNYVMWF